MKRSTNRLIVLLIAASAAHLLSGCGAPTVNQNSSHSPNTTNTANAKADTGTDARSATCTKQDDQQIVEQIRILIDGDSALRPHRGHINYSTRICQVTLRGWVDTWDNFKNLYGKVSNAGGVRSVDISAFELRPQAATPTPSGSPGLNAEQCPAGTKQCRELCIPNDEDCTIIID